MTETLNQNDIDKLLKQVDLLFEMPSIIDITPAELSRIRDDETRRNMERKFYLINELFIAPLQAVLNKCTNAVNSKQSYSCDFSAYSLIQRMRLISKELLIFGYQPSDLRTLIPHTVEEVNEKIRKIESYRAFRVIDSKNPNIGYTKSA